MVQCSGGRVARRRCPAEPAADVRAIPDWGIRPAESGGHRGWGRPGGGCPRWSGPGPDRVRQCHRGRTHHPPDAGDRPVIPGGPSDGRRAGPSVRKSAGAAARSRWSPRFDASGLRRDRSAAHARRLAVDSALSDRVYAPRRVAARDGGARHRPYREGLRRKRPGRCVVCG